MKIKVEWIVIIVLNLQQLTTTDPLLSSNGRGIIHVGSSVTQGTNKVETKC